MIQLVFKCRPFQCFQHVGDTVASGFFTMVCLEQTKQLLYKFISNSIK